MQTKVQSAVKRQMEELNLKSLCIDEYVFAKRINEIINCAEQLEDDRSVEVYSEVIESRLMMRESSMEIFDRNTYFALPQFFTFDQKEVFVDCGAFVGETIEQYLFSHCGTFDKIFAFEPEIKNYNAMKVRIERLINEWQLSEEKIQLVNGAVGLETIEGTINQNGIGSRITTQSNEGERIKIYSLNDYFKNQRISFLKADIESYELDMLKGAEEIIRRDLPKMAIAIYHNASDLYSIMKWINELKLEYKFSVRNHQPPIYDTVLYAYQ